MTPPHYCISFCFKGLKIDGAKRRETAQHFANRWGLPYWYFVDDDCYNVVFRGNDFAQLELLRKALSDFWHMTRAAEDLNG